MMTTQNSNLVDVSQFRPAGAFGAGEGAHGGRSLAIAATPLVYSEMERHAMAEGRAPGEVLADFMLSAHYAVFETLVRGRETAFSYFIYRDAPYKAHAGAPAGGQRLLMLMADDED